MTTKEQTIAELTKAIGFQTTEIRNRDADDFRSVAVWSVTSALDKAYEAGRAQATGNTGYNILQIAWELERTAMGDGFYGNAMRVAKDVPGLTDVDRSLLDRYATGKQSGNDHVALQELAMRIAKATWSAV